MPGSVHDARVFRYSGLQQMCAPEFFPEGTHVLADSAYTLQENVLVPYRDNGYLSPEERYFNRCLSGARATVERAIGLLKMRWRILLNEFPIRRRDLQPFIIYAICILHNICLMRENEFFYPIIPPDIDEVDDGPLFATAQQRQMGNLIRMRLTNEMNNNV